MANAQQWVCSSCKQLFPERAGKRAVGTTASGWRGCARISCALVLMQPQFLPHLKPNVRGLSGTHGTSDFVSKRRCSQRTNLRRCLLPGCWRLYVLQVFHSLCWHQEQMTLAPPRLPFTKASIPTLQTAADRSAQRVTAAEATWHLGAALGLPYLHLYVGVVCLWVCVRVFWSYFSHM